MVLNRTSSHVLVLAAVHSIVFACSTESSDQPGTKSFASGGFGSGVASTSISTAGTGGVQPVGGAYSSSGAASSGGVSASHGTNPSSGGGATSPAGGSSNAMSGGAPAAGAAQGGAQPTGGVTASGGTTDAAAGMTAGGAVSGGAPNSEGGAMSSGGSSPGGAGQTAGEPASAVRGIDGLRIDDPCSGTPSITDGATCNHTTLTNNRFRASKEVAVGGDANEVYDVTLRIRGVVEPTNIDGGSRPDTSTFVYKSEMWRKVPYTIGGTVKQADYEQWSITVSAPPQTYFLNDYQKGAHNIFKLDYPITIPIAAGAKVTLECSDSNEREIVNYEKYTLEGLPGSLNFGQFVQVNVVAAKAR
ncbi:MAG TPA: hypothetical protein VFQ61_18550 [Polyangiaceae bacterium]|nr:hypothetical protein [Polyangiaceae bacterium]